MAKKQRTMSDDRSASDAPVVVPQLPSAAQPDLVRAQQKDDYYRKVKIGKINPLTLLGKFSLRARARCIVIFMRLTLFSLLSLKHHVTIHSSYLNPSLIPSGSCSDRNFGTINWMRLNLSVTFCTLQPPPGATRKRSEKVGRVSSLSLSLCTCTNLTIYFDCSLSLSVYFHVSARAQNTRIFSPRTREGTSRALREGGRWWRWRRWRNRSGDG